MATPVTDWETVRTTMVTTIKALTPGTLSQYPYHVTETEMAGFREYAEGFTSNAFRQYEINDIADDVEGPQDMEVQIKTMDAELVVAYPHEWGLYRTKDGNNQHNEAAMRAVAHNDRNALDKAIGIRGGANYASGQSVCRVGTVTFEELDDVTFMVMPLEIRYYQAN